MNTERSNTPTSPEGGSQLTQVEASERHRPRRRANFLVRAGVAATLVLSGVLADRFGPELFYAVNRSAGVVLNLPATLQDTLQERLKAVVREAVKEVVEQGSVNGEGAVDGELGVEEEESAKEATKEAAETPPSEATETPAATAKPNPTTTPTSTPTPKPKATATKTPEPAVTAEEPEEGAAPKATETPNSTPTPEPNGEATPTPPSEATEAPVSEEAISNPDSNPDTEMVEVAPGVYFSGPSGAKPRRLYDPEIQGDPNTEGFKVVQESPLWAVVPSLRHVLGEPGMIFVDPVGGEEARRILENNPSAVKMETLRVPSDGAKVPDLESGGLLFMGADARFSWTTPDGERVSLEVKSPKYGTTFVYLLGPDSDGNTPRDLNMLVDASVPQDQENMHRFIPFSVTPGANAFFSLHQLDQLVKDALMIDTDSNVSNSTNCRGADGCKVVRVVAIDSVTGATSVVSFELGDGNDGYLAKALWKNWFVNSK